MNTNRLLIVLFLFGIALSSFVYFSNRLIGGVSAQTSSLTYSWNNTFSVSQNYNTGPCRAASDSNGRLFISNKKKILLYNENDEYISSFKGDFKDACGVALDTDNNIYVTDIEGHNVKKFNKKFKLMKTWGTKGTANGQFDSPLGITVVGNNVYIADSGNSRIQIFDREGTFIKKFGEQGKKNGKFKNPGDVVLDHMGNIYVADSNNNRIQKFNKKGEWLKMWGSYGEGDGQFDSPNDLSIDSISGRLYIADYFNHRVVVYNFEGEYLAQINPINASTISFTNVPGVTFISDNRIYILGGYKDLEHWKLNTTLTGTPTLTPTVTPTGTQPTATPTATPTSAPTPTPNPDCVCGATNLCDTSCPKRKLKNMNYPSTVTCVGPASIYTTQPTQQDKTAVCRSVKRRVGDANADGVINDIDYDYYTQVVLGAKIPPRVNPDFNADGEVGSQDREIIIKRLTRNEDEETD